MPLLSVDPPGNSQSLKPGEEICVRNLQFEIQQIFFFTWGGLTGFITLLLKERVHPFNYELSNHPMCVEGSEWKISCVHWCETFVSMEKMAQAKESCQAKQWWHLLECKWSKNECCLWGIQEIIKVYMGGGSLHIIALSHVLECCWKE